jgi:predicted DNA-binding transcriptional regulator YafY
MSDAETPSDPRPGSSDRLERLLNLVIALRETRRPMTTREIHERVAGYGQQDWAAFRRMFERDKADLRDLGVPIAVVPVDRWDPTEGYRIDPRHAELPPLALEPEEVTALSLAASVTGLDTLTRSGLRKLEIDADAPGVTEAAPQVGVELPLAAPHLPSLLAAHRTRTPVTFAYRTADGRDTSRTVDPHGLVHRSGRWYLVGYDHDRAADRAFRLDRITGDVVHAGPPGSAGAALESVAVDDVLPERPPARSAEVWARQTALAEARAAAEGEPEPAEGAWWRLQTTFRDPHRLAGWALRLAPDAVVVAPPDAVAAFHRAATALAGPQ